MNSLTNSLRGALLVFLAIGMIGTAGADAGLIDYSSLVYVVFDNLLLLCAGIAVVVGVASQRDAATPLDWRRTALIAAGLSALLSFGLLSARPPLTGYHLLLIAVIGATVGIATAAIARIPATEPLSGAAPRSPHLAAGLIAVTLIAAALRIWQPGTPLLTWVFAPLLLVIPGLSLASALLPASDGWTQPLLYAIPLSLGVYLISLAWFTRLGIPVTPTAIFGVALAATCAGLVVRRRTPSAPFPNNDIQE